MMLGCVMLFVSLSFDGATGAYEDKIMSNDHVGPFELMFNIQLGKAILAFLGLVMLNEIDYFFAMVQETGPVLIVLLEVRELAAREPLVPASKTASTASHRRETK